MRIIAGTHRGRRIAAPKGDQTRPTGDRVREALFNLVGPVEDASVLDLYAGSGALGLEALSRGARRCVFAETDPAASRVIRQNLETLGLTGALVLQRDAVSVLREERTAGRRHELILLDPPYEGVGRARARAGRPPSRGRERHRPRRRRDRRPNGACAPTRPRHDAAVRFRPAHPLRAMTDRHPIVAINPGTFDPVTLGHVDVIRRAAAIFDRVVVGVVRDPQHKQTTFTVEERVSFLEDALSELDDVIVDVFSELVVDFARKHGARTMVKGLRVIADFEWEFQMNRLNHLLAPEVETMYVMSSPEFAFVSSSGVKEIASFGGNVEGLVTAAVAKRFREMYPNGRPGAPLSPQD